MSAAQDRKELLRKDVLAKRMELDNADWNSRSDKIIEHLLNTDVLKNADSIHTYVSMNGRNEVKTDQLLEYLLNIERSVFVPITNFKEGTLSHAELKSLSELKPNKWGVKEPKNSTPADISNLDMIVVPMAAADRTGNRLGYGKGFYDRFLVQTNAFKIGLVFQEFLFDTIPVEEFDVKLDGIITENEVIFP